MNYDIETEVINRYEEGAKKAQPSLCCPTEYDNNYLQVIPEEIITKDYGCGDPTRYINQGETVLDLGSGAGKNCYIIAQKVGKNGRVIGIDFNNEMLSLANKYKAEITNKLGYDNIQFFKGKIQDLKLPLLEVEEWLKNYPISSLEDLRKFDQQCDYLKREKTLIKDSSIDVIVSNCVLNLVKTEDKQNLFQEIYRVLKTGGRAVISDIVCDENPTDKIINDPELWSGCISGAFKENEFLKMFENVGFYGIEILERQFEPWQVIDGIEFRSLTVSAYKGKEGKCLETNQAVIYKGPWKKVEDDDNHTYLRGERMAVCQKTYDILTNEKSPYQQDIIPIPSYQEIPLEKAEIYNCEKEKIRYPHETKGNNYQGIINNNNSDILSNNKCC